MKRKFTKYPSSYVPVAKKETQIETVMDLVEASNYTIPLDSDGRYNFKVVTVDKENFPDMPESLETQLNQEGKYGGYVAIIPGNRPLTIDELPIYGDPNRWVTKWIYSTPQEAVRQMHGERGIKLFNKLYKNNVAASTTKYSSNYVKASTDNRYPYYIDNYNQFSGYIDNDNDILSLTDLGNIYDTLVSDDDPEACKYSSFDSWLDSLIDSGALSGCWMSDAQRSDMPYEFGGYDPEWEEFPYYDDDEYYNDNI